MIKGPLPTNSTTTDRLRWWAKTESEDFSRFWGVEIVKKKFFQKARHLVVIYTPKEVRSP